MDPVIVVDAADIQPVSTESLRGPLHAPPTLTGSERHHVFVSYSSTDNQWTHSIINQLESRRLQVCYHERDFTPGRTVLENMSECIQESQKVLLVLSQEFVRSRWCLLEANMSLFRDCLERKPIIPVLLEPDVPIPLHLCHLTYLDASDPGFMKKLLKVLYTPNQQLQSSTVVPFQPPSIYNGKALQPLVAVNEEELNKWNPGHFNDMNVPDQLRLIIEDQEKYKQAIRIINRVAENQLIMCFFGNGVLLTLFLLFVNSVVAFTSIVIYAFVYDSSLHVSIGLQVIGILNVIMVGIGFLIYAIMWKKDQTKNNLRAMQKAAGEANIILSEEKLLIGCMSNSKLSLVYVFLDGCKQEFAETFSEDGNAENMFKKALRYFSSGYACCLTKRHFPFSLGSSGGHLEGGVCFCQYVSQQLRTEQWE
ncbi:uncharacterized protein LOC115392045 [Salarias fasciatus]|uniref:uncharacterized protein LOC115392045 n=1 Tax=Salarias fasciatus TaxID=181472 RepID=UPI0011765593|nr:uncharacterized protein LOC115392045 [Salarias fasciatus]